MEIILQCWKLANREGIRLRRGYGKGVRKHRIMQRFRKDPRKRKAAHRAQRRLKTTAGILLFQPSYWKDGGRQIRK